MEARHLPATKKAKFTKYLVFLCKTVTFTLSWH